MDVRLRAALVIAAGSVLVATCQSAAPIGEPDFDSLWPEGTCMVVTGSGDAITEVGNVGCSEPHTHVVIARVGAGVACPPGTDEQTGQPGIRFKTWCLRAETSTPGPTR